MSNAFSCVLIISENLLRIVLPPFNDNYCTALQISGFRVLEEVFGCLPVDKTGKDESAEKDKREFQLLKKLLKRLKGVSHLQNFIYIHTHIYDVMDRTILQGTAYLHRQPDFEVMALLENLSS